jgi:hypothetical protein
MGYVTGLPILVYVNGLADLGSLALHRHSSHEALGSS